MGTSTSTGAGTGAGAGGGAGGRVGAAILAACLVLAASACDSEPPPPAPEVVADVHALRTLMIDDPAERPLEEVERVAPDRPVLAARMLGTGALPAARRQVTLVREAAMTSPEGRSLARRLARAYEQRVRGLEAWHGYLEDGAIDEAAHLEGLTTRRQAEVAILALDQEMERYVPTEPRSRGSRDDGDRVDEPGDEGSELEPGELERPGRHD